MKCQTFGAFFLAFALPTLAANLEQPTVEIAESPEAAVQEQSQDLERRLAPAIPILASLIPSLFAAKGNGKRDLDTADHDLERRIAPVIPILASFIPSLFAAKGNGKRDLDGSNDAEAVLAELASAIESESHLDRRFFPGLTILQQLLGGKGKRDLEGLDAADAHLDRRFLPVFSIFKNLLSKGKRDLEGVDQADAEAALAELASMIEDQSDASLERRRFRLPITNILPLIPSIPGLFPSGNQNARRSLDEASADPYAELAAMIAADDANADAQLDRRFLPGLTILQQLLGGKGKRDLESADQADVDAAYAELASMIAADGADTDAQLDRRFFPGLTILQQFLGGKGKRDLDGLDAADAHLDRRFLPVLGIFKKIFGKSKRDLDASDAAALEELAAALSASEGDAALQRRIAPAIPIFASLFGSLLAGKGKSKRDVDADADAALAELASLIEADPSLLGRRNDEAAATEEQTTSSHLSSADLAEVLAPVLEQAAAGEAEKRDETIARMRVARGIVV